MILLLVEIAMRKLSRVQLIVCYTRPLSSGTGPWMETTFQLFSVHDLCRGEEL